MSMMTIIVSAKDAASAILSGISRQITGLGKAALRLGGLGGGGLFATLAVGAGMLSRELVKIAQAASETGNYDLISAKQVRQVENGISILKEYRTQAALALASGVAKLFGNRGGNDVSEAEYERQRVTLQKQVDARRELHELQYEQLDNSGKMESLDRRIATMSANTDEERLAVAQLLVKRKKLQADMDRQAADESERAADAERERLAVLAKEAEVAAEVAAKAKEQAAVRNLDAAMAVKGAFLGEGGLRGAMRAAKDKAREDQRFQRAVELANRNLERQGIDPNAPGAFRGKLSQADRRDLMLAQAGAVIGQAGNPDALAAKAIDALHITVKERLGVVGGA